MIHWDVAWWWYHFNIALDSMHIVIGRIQLLIVFIFIVVSVIFIIQYECFSILLILIVVSFLGAFISSVCRCILFIHLSWKKSLNGTNRSYVFVCLYVSNLRWESNLYLLVRPVNVENSSTYWWNYSAVCLNILSGCRIAVRFMYTRMFVYFCVY